jgi:hypothetical protein
MAASPVTREQLMELDEEFRDMTQYLPLPAHDEMPLKEMRESFKYIYVSMSREKDSWNRPHGTRLCPVGGWRLNAFPESEFCLVNTTIPVPGSDGVELPARYIIPATEDENETFPLLLWIPGEGMDHCLVSLFSRGVL